MGAEVNDRRIIESMLALDIDGALDRAVRERSACSIGGAAAAMSFARATGTGPGRLVGYMSSHDVHPDESFVGYAGILYGLKSISRGGTNLRIRSRHHRRASSSAPSPASGLLSRHARPPAGGCFQSSRSGSESPRKRREAARRCANTPPGTFANRVERL